jgi:DNA segregation ATPase FtsK/SpoIIIE, S-DNA-T family
MPDEPAPRPWRMDAAALTLLLCGALVAAAILSEPVPNDSGLSGFFPNFLGEPGGWLRERLVDALGLAVYVLVAGWTLMAVALFQCGNRWHWCTRVIGWLVLVVGAAIAADRGGSAALGGPVAGSGGALGATLSLWLEDRFTLIGGSAVYGAGMLIGLTLAAERFVAVAGRGVCRIGKQLFVWMRWVVAGVLRGLGIAARLLGRLVPRRRPAVPGKKLRPVGVPRLTSRQASAGGIPIHHHDESSAHDQPESPATPPPEPAPLAFDLPPLTLLDDPAPFPYEKHDEHLREVAGLLEKTFADFGLTVKVVGIHTGPVITQYEIALETGLRVARVTALADDLALGLKVPSVRIVAPLPGRNTVGVEVPNEHRAIVRLKELVTASTAKTAKAKLPLFLGKDTEGRALLYDLADMPHLLIAGRTGTGKSVCLNSIILSLLLARRPDECKLLMIDPKQVELAEYAKLPHLMHPVVTDNTKAEAILAWAVDKMEERYEILRRARVRNIAGFNELAHEEILRRVKPVDAEEQKRVPPRMPYIVIVVDEVGDLMMAMKKEVEGHIIRLAQKSRAAGIHLILTTQRPTVDVITGLIKSNLPARICFQVADRSNSRVVLDEVGAEKLLGKGDMLFLQPNTSTIVRAQGTYASDEEIIRIVSELEVDTPVFDSELMNLQEKAKAGGRGGVMEQLRKRDDLYEQAIEVVVREGRGSVSLLQRALGIGYGRAARLIDFMAEDGIVGHYNGAQAREVLFTPEQWEQLKGGGDDGIAMSA